MFCAVALTACPTLVVVSGAGVVINVVGRVVTSVAVGVVAVVVSVVCAKAIPLVAKTDKILKTAIFLSCQCCLIIMSGTFQC